MATEAERRSGAEAFARDWQGRGYEKGETQPFWLQLLRDVCGAKRPESLISFEQGVKLAHAAFIDAVIPSTHVLIEQKGRGHDLRKAQRQSDGTLLTPYEQARRYANELPYSQRPRWIVVCNFAEFHIHDMEKAGGQPLVLPLEELPKSFHLLDFLVDEDAGDLWRQKAVSVEAGEIVGRLHALLRAQYLEPDSPRALKSLNVLCVRLVFCLYAEDTGLFGKKGLFCEYLSGFSTGQMRRALIDLFAVLDTPVDQRDPYLDPALAAFPYVNGGLFAEADIEIPLFTEELRKLLLQRSSREFDWSVISPTIFGALFESTLNPETRRSGGMHYTSIENIHKVIDPLFLDGLKARLTEAKAARSLRARSQKLRDLWNDMAALSFLDPAAGSGNFLTETYLCLRRLENEIIRELHDDDQHWLDGTRPVKVSIANFYGIEINDFAVAVARTALWIAESQMLLETEKIVHRELEFLPLKTSAHIAEGNALRMDWNEVVPAERLNYIMGNPPFRGARWMSAEQKAEVLDVFPDVKNAGNLDYVSCWYGKAAALMRTAPHVHAAFVSTNSITQGDQASILWNYLFSLGTNISFAHRTFKWNSEAQGKAAVHCVIIGFGMKEGSAKTLYEEGRRLSARHINGYLLDAPGMCVETRQKPLCAVPEISMGNQPIDGGNYLFSREEKEAFLKKEPGAAPYFRRWLGADEFINGRERWCLWLGDIEPSALRRLPECLKRVEAVRQFRLASKRKSTLKLADTPRRFQTENMPDTEYIVIPEVSSERREYIPIGFLTPDILCSNKLRLMPDGTKYHFGVLISLVHMAWMRVVCGRLKSDYDYSIKIVYNNFPWPEEAEAHRAAIKKTAQGILDARALYSESSLADLYDTAAMPQELRRAHRANDKAVLAAYGLAPDMAEADIVAALMARYQALAAL
ncbi:MAG: class I SAM-dependent DNA methyltransferase [Desulfovibrionaceae bacterium]|nr:class I SAM-dependent DNA methyltransferase [Desulfovibrionaceae bacterium]